MKVGHNMHATTKFGPNQIVVKAPMPMTFAIAIAETTWHGTFRVTGLLLGNVYSITSETALYGNLLAQ